MYTFVFTYSIVWLVLVLYVVRLGIRQHRLIQIVNALQSQIDNPTRFAEQRTETAA